MRLSSEAERPGVGVSSKPVRTPYEKAAARVPPPENDSATTVSS